MKTRDVKLHLVVRSEKVARLVEFDVPIVSSYGRMGATKKWARVYDYVLDERQASTLAQAQELATDAGLPLEVTDLSQENFLKRLLGMGSKRSFDVRRARRPQRVPEGPMRLEELAVS